ncbi:MAG: hypothetical protein NWR72_21200 [Bacteroidia bacterium]|nr:hypothetical protein [Bacteroidia bacterium]
MAQDYDKIIKENIEEILPALIDRVLGLQLTYMEVIPFDVQVTLERRPDFLLLVRTEQIDKNFLLQIEFQSKNDSEMVDRMLEYAAILRRKHKLQLRQYVLYIGNEVASMSSEISDPDLWYRYHLVNLKNFDYHGFVNSTHPEVIILSILCNYRGHEPADVIRQILLRLRELSNQGVRIDKYMQQLEVLSNLRNLHKEIILQSRNMAFTYDLTQDLRYLEGVDVGKTQTQLETAKKMLLSKPFLVNALTYSDIAEVTGLAVEKVKDIHQEIQMDNPST